jgi:quercetin dioxygenase-like cupin family protein
LPGIDCQLKKKAKQMLLNEDLSAPARVDATALDWVPSPARGVDRRMLFRIGNEKARATSIVRYAAGSQFSYHRHPGGEEFLVLDGVFQDETGDFCAGTYVRNPPGSGHAPRTKDGCTIFVKLWQFRVDDDEHIVRRPGEGSGDRLRSGVSEATVLFNGADERVMLERWQANAVIELSGFKGLELLVLDGDLIEAGTKVGPLTWFRLPAGTSFRARVGAEGALVWYKNAPLLHEQVCPFDIPPS